MTNTLSLTIGQHSVAGRKDENEDSYGILIPEQPLLDTKGVAMVIADGMSGSDAGKEASEMCVKSFLTDYFATSETLTVKTAAGQALSALNRWLHGQGQAVYQSHRGMVSTMSAMVLKSSTAHIFHVGDSRISRLRDGQLKHLTKDHRMIVSKEKVSSAVPWASTSTSMSTIAPYWWNPEICSFSPPMASMNMSATPR